MDHNSSLSFSEFKLWYTRSDNDIDDIVTSASRHVSLDELKRLTNLDKVRPEELMQMFAERTNDQGVIDRENFYECFELLAGKDMSEEDLTKFRIIMAGLYDMFDENGDGVDFAEVTSGFSILCGGSKEIKAAAAFALYDVDHNGVITLDEMISYLTSVFKVLYHSTPGTEDEMGMNARDLAVETAKEAFRSADKDHNSELSYDEFCAWYSNKEEETEEEEEEKGEEEEDVTRLAVLANLRAFEPSEILEMFANRVDDRGNISYEVFSDIIESVSVTRDKPLTSKEKILLEKKMKGIYRSLDTNHDSVVQFSELAAGITVLCGGSASSKIETAFSLFDYNNDSRISQDEMCRYLRSVYSIVYEADPTARSRMGGADPETLARVTTSDAFQSLGKKGADATLSFDEFKRWCEMDNSENTTSMITNASSKMSLGEVRRLTCLDSMRTQDVFDCFMRRAREENDGTISKESFHRTIEELSTMGGSRVLSEEDQDRLRVLISGLHATFDVDGDGKVDTQELLSGLTILCGGDVEEKCRASFELYDTDHSQSISREEMESHLTSVYLVVYHVESDTADITGVDAKTLARETTRDAFENAEHLNEDGTMSYETFRDWYLSTTTQTDEEEEDEEEKMNEETRDVVVKENASQENWISLAEIRRVTNLKTTNWMIS